MKTTYKRRPVAKNRDLQKSILFCKFSLANCTKNLLCNLLCFPPFHTQYSGSVTKTKQIFSKIFGAIGFTKKYTFL